MKKEELFSVLCPNKEYTEHDLRFNELYYLVQTSGMPQEQIGKKLIPENCDLLAFQKLASIQRNIKNFVDSGKNVYLHSTNCGNGKTTWSVKLLIQYFGEIWAGNCYNERGYFIHVPTFLQRIKRQISSPSADFEVLLKKVCDVDIIVWDDIAATKLSDYDYNNLLMYIDQRIGKTNIYTGNIHPANLSAYVGDRLKSRILGNAEVIELTGSDRRLQ